MELKYKFDYSELFDRVYAHYNSYTSDNLNRFMKDIDISRGKLRLILCGRATFSGLELASIKDLLKLDDKTFMKCCFTYKKNPRL